MLNPNIASWFTIGWKDGDPFSDSDSDSGSGSDVGNDTGDVPIHSRSASPPQPRDKGNGKEIDIPFISKKSCLVSIPAELIDAVLSFLGPADLCAVSATCRTLYDHSRSDLVWQRMVQDNVPGVRVKTPYPYDNFHDLYQAHDPHWFLPKYKIWFSDGDLTGRVVIARYDQRRGCIEGYQMVAASTERTTERWAADQQVIIHNFKPLVQLHMDKPILELMATDPEEYDEFGNEIQTFGGMTTIKLSQERRKKKSDDKPSPSSPNNATKGGAPTSSSRGDVEGPPSPDTRTNNKHKKKTNQFEAEIPMQIGSLDSMYSTFMHARRLTEEQLADRIEPRFPYGNIWPPPEIPSPHRVQGASLHRFDTKLRPETRPSTRPNTSDRSFRVRKWLTMRVPEATPSNILASSHDPAHATGSPYPGTGSSLPFLAAHQRSMRLHIGEEVSTYATFDPKLYTPTKAKPFRGIWVGDYSGHGCEFLLITQPDDDDDDLDNGLDLDRIQREDGETEEDFERRWNEEVVYRGSLQAVKLSGDPNVPRGEITFRAADIGKGGYIGTCRDAPFAGVRMVRSEGHIASTGFVQDKFIDSQLLMISPDRLAQYWIEWGHISFFERVDIDQFLVPT